MTCDRCPARAVQRNPTLCAECAAWWLESTEPFDESVTPFVYRRIVAAQSVAEVRAAFRSLPLTFSTVSEIL